MPKKVSELLKLVDEAKHKRGELQDAVEARTRSAFALYEFNTMAPPVLDQSPKARAQREILRIAAQLRWEAEVERFLDRHGVHTLGDLDLEAIEQLRDRMRRLLESARLGCEPDDYLEAC